MSYRLLARLDRLLRFFPTGDAVGHDEHVRVSEFVTSAPGARVAAVSAGARTVEDERGTFLRGHVARFECVRVEMLRARHVAALPATVPVVVEHVEVRLAEARLDLVDRQLGNVVHY